MSQLRKNTIQLTLAMVGQKAVAFFYFLLLARFVGTESTGAYFLALSVTTIFSVVSDMGLQPVLIREVAKRQEGWQDRIRTALALKLGWILLGAGLVAGFVWFMDYPPLVRQLSLLAIGVMALDAISLLMFGVLRGYQTLRFESLGMLIGQGLTALVGGVSLWLEAPLAWLVVALIVGSGWNALYATWAVAQTTKGEHLLKPHWSFPQVKDLLHMAWPFALAGIFVKVYSYVDTLFLSHFFGEQEVGIYAVAYKLTYSLQFLPMAFVAALYPALSERIHHDQKAVSELFEQSMVYLALLAAPIVFGIWSIAEPLVRLAVGEAFLPAASVLSVLIFVLLPLFLDFPIGSLLNAANRQATKTVLMGVTMLVNVVANLLLIPRFGVMGAAISANVSFFLLFFLGCCYVPGLIGGVSGRLVWQILRILAAGAAMGGVIRLLSSSWSVPFLIVLGGAAYVVFLFLFRSIRFSDLRRWYEKEHSSHA